MKRSAKSFTLLSLILFGHARLGADEPVSNKDAPNPFVIRHSSFGLGTDEPVSNRDAGLWQLAQAPAPGGPLRAPPGMQRRTDKPDGLTPEIDSLVKKLLETYQKADSYRDQGRVKLVQQSGRVKTTTEMPMELAFKRPNQLRLDAGQYMAACDGQTLYFVVPELNQYTAVKAPPRIEKNHLQAGSAMGGAEEGHPELIDFLTRAEAYDLLMAQVTKIGLSPDATVAGTPCRVLHYETVQGTRLTNYIDAKRMVLLKVEAETPPTPQGLSPSVATPPQPLTRLWYELGRIEINSRIDARGFAYKPPAGFRRVSQIGPTQDPLADPRSGPPGASGGAEGAHLLGKPAPSISGTDLSGKPLTAAELRGKAVLLFFWAIGGGEYSLRSIPTVQQVADHFKHRPDVLVLGINGDAEQATVVAQLLERKKATFRTLVDPEMKLQQSFELGGWPTFVVVGRDGLVKWAKLGAPPSLKQDLLRELEKCVKP